MNIAKHENFTEAPRHLLKDRPNSVTSLLFYEDRLRCLRGAWFQCRLNIELEHIIDTRCRRMFSIPRIPRKKTIANNRQQPRPGTFSALLVKTDECPQHGLLHDVLRDIGPSCEISCQRVSSIQMNKHGLFKRGKGCAVNCFASGGVLVFQPQR